MFWELITNTSIKMWSWYLFQDNLGCQLSLLDIGGGFPGTEDFPVKFEEVNECVGSDVLLNLIV